ncbi:uncharacterized protein LOC143198399 [Rhynchophorus ferrugineus]|uniref:Uncharacterized protein n=1 Tax=Rhynchophorus ferrugineus TaxID=354439 RepID=A0A834IPR2_RHYFE|nr:hypothetical protein GWI33_001904 [Rhynchophorus ferrugineus]
MENCDENEPLPLILKETESIYKTSELNKEKLHKSRNELEQKHRYLAHLDKQKDDIMKTVAEKQATLSTLQTHAKHYESTNMDLKIRAMKITKTFNELYKEISSMENNYVDVENRINKIENITNSVSTSKKQIDSLQNKIDELKSNLEIKKKTTEKRTCAIQMENENLKKQLAYMNNLKNDMFKSNDENALAVLENRSIELEKKIDALKQENDFLRSEYETACQLLDQTELKNQGLDLSYNEVNGEINSLSDKIAAVKNEQTQLAISKDDLEKRLKELDDKLREADDIWNCLQNEDFTIKQDIDLIKRDIAEREKQINIKKCELSNTNQLIKKEDENIEQITTDINKIKIELNEIINSTHNSESSVYYTDQIEQIKQNIIEIQKEKGRLLQIKETKETELKAILDQLNNDRNSNTVELMTLKNHKMVEISALEKKLSDLKLISSKLEAEVKSSESVESQLNENLKKLKEKQTQLLVEFKQTEKELAEVKNRSEMILPKTGIKRPRVLPKAREDKASNPGAKRNWDSDSSMEVEELKFNEYLKRKSKKVYKGF